MYMRVHGFVWCAKHEMMERPADVTRLWDLRAVSRVSVCRPCGDEVTGLRERGRLREVGRPRAAIRGERALPSR